LILYAAFAAGVLASVVWLIALCTNGWVELILPKPGVYLPSLRGDVPGKLVLVEKLWTGMWNFCRVEYTNTTAGSAASVASSTDSEGLYTLKGTSDAFKDFVLKAKAKDLVPRPRPRPISAQRPTPRT